MLPTSRKSGWMIKKFAKKFSSVRMQLVASVFVAIAPVLVLTYIVNQMLVLAIRARLGAGLFHQMCRGSA